MSKVRTDTAVGGRNADDDEEGKQRNVQLDTEHEATEGNVASRTRRQQSRDGPDQEAQHAARSSTHVSPAMRIYRHALESIFSMLQLGDLIPILAVSRSWAAAARSMKPIHASIERDECGWERDRIVFRPLPPIASLVGSPLLRHIATIHIRHSGLCWTPFNTETLGLLTQHAPNLQSLWCDLTLTSNKPLLFPAKLASLELQLHGRHTAAEVNGVLTALAACSSLSHLVLRLPSFEHGNFAAAAGVDLSLLAACRSLSSLKFEGISKFSDAQINQIRLALGHLHRLSVGSMADGQLARLLQSPVTAQWRDIGFVRADARTSELLLRLPSATELNLSYDENTPHVDFLQQLPGLAVLTLDCHKWSDRNSWFIPADTLLASLVRCRGVTELSLCCGLNSAQWTALFAKLPLKQLTIRRCESLETLACFATGPITQSLEVLTLEEVYLPPSELSHLYALGRLRTLRLACSLSLRLSAATLASLSPPTPLLPSLTLLCYQWRMVEDSVDRRGPSFEWMQARLLQQM